MKKVKILITVEGGVVQNICTNCEAEIVVIDYDRKGDEPVIVSEILSPDSISDEKFHTALFSDDQMDVDDRFTQNALKDLDF